MTRSLHKIRPGRYVWMEDGKVVGKATDEEADAWIGITLYPDPPILESVQTLKYEPSKLYVLVSLDAANPAGLVAGKRGLDSRALTVKRTGGGFVVGPIGE